MSVRQRKVGRICRGKKSIKIQFVNIYEGKKPTKDTIC
jgi:hypothetical protein